MSTKRRDVKFTGEKGGTHHSRVMETNIIRVRAEGLLGLAPQCTKRDTRPLLARKKKKA